MPDEFDSRLPGEALRNVINEAKAKIAKHDEKVASRYEAAGRHFLKRMERELAVANATDNKDEELFHVQRAKYWAELARAHLDRADEVRARSRTN